MNKPESTVLPRLVITPGEPAGIGPDICLMAARQAYPAQRVVMADPDLLAERARALGLAITLEPFDPNVRVSARAGCLQVCPVPLAVTCQAGQLDPGNSGYVLNTLEQAVQGCLSGQFDALVTGPVHKGVINQAGIAFTGHTEFLAAQTATSRVVMMLATEGLRVALATTHLPLAQVPKAITRASLTEVVQILHRDMQSKFAIDRPKILVCGLNPHAGENGYLGREEIEVITPVLDSLRQQGMDLVGPLPADTLFTPRYLDSADAVLAMYHDQGLPVLKYRGFGRAVNITLGLPLVRTSVDHGTALDLAGTGRAGTGSLLAALDAARTMV